MNVLLKLFKGDQLRRRIHKTIDNLSFRLIDKNRERLNAIWSHVYRKGI